MGITAPQQLRQTIDAAVAQAKLTDVHTHLYPPCFGDLLLWGIDELITYHYLIAETFRWVEMPYADYRRMPKRDQADLIWKTLFLDNSPIAESCRGVLTALRKLGLDAASRDLVAYRSYFSKMTVAEYVDPVFEVG